MIYDYTCDAGHHRQVQRSINEPDKHTNRVCGHGETIEVTRGVTAQTTCQLRLWRVYDATAAVWKAQRSTE